MNIPGDTYWSWNGTSLSTFAWNIEQLYAGIGGIPPLRGTDLLIPGRTGRIFVPKIADSRTITLRMWIAGADADGNVIDHDAFGQNIRALRALLYSSLTQGALAKRFKPNAAGAVITATAQAQLIGGLEVEANEALDVGTTDAEFSLANPYFFDGATPYL